MVGLGKLAVEEVMPAFGACSLSRPVALVSHNPEVAQEVATTYGIDRGRLYDYEGFERIAKDDAIDIVYVLVPNSMHAAYTVRALEAGKHVLCEKPMATSVAEAQRMIDAAKKADRKLMIAYRLHYEPLNMKVMELCREKALGRVVGFTSHNCQTLSAPNIRLSAGLGGGPLGDIGIYSINAARYCLGDNPVEVSAMAHQPPGDPIFREVPESVALTLRFPSGALATCYCSFGAAKSRQYRVLCENGYVDMDPAFEYQGLRLTVMRTDTACGVPERAELVIDEVDHFAAEMDHFSRAVLEGHEPRTPGEEGLADMRVLAAVEEAIRTRRTVRVAD